MDIGVLLFICSVVVGLLVVIYMWYTFLIKKVIIFKIEKGH